MRYAIRRIVLPVLASGLTAAVLMLPTTAWGQSWSIHETPSPKAELSAHLSSVSCVLSEACASVGTYVNGAGHEVTSAATWNGKSWTADRPANPLGTKSSHLLGVSCVFVDGFCLAVGRYLGSSGGEAPLAETSVVSEGVWSLDQPLIPSGAKNSALQGVSCTANEACTAVGLYVNSGGTEVSLAERLSGKTWTIQETPNPKEAKTSVLAGVSCTSSEACVAVGRYVSSAGVEKTLVEVLSGKTWTVQESPNPAGAKASSLAGVSCTSSEACTAVGRYTNSSGIETALAERWNGKTWTIQTLPTPAGPQFSSLASVSCTTSEACLGVGRYFNNQIREAGLGASWNGKEWISSEIASPVGEVSVRFASVSCVLSESCAGVGHYINGARVEVTAAGVWNGKTWTTVTPPNPLGAKASELSNVSCVFTGGFCLAVGYYSNSSGVQVPLGETSALLEGVWSVDLPLVPSGAKSSALQGVSCTASEACTAVGSYVNSGGTEVTLAEKLSGKTWTIQEPPNPAEAKASSLTGVSCTSSEACVAVGHYVSSAGVEKTLVEVLSGKTWTVQESPNPAEAKASSLAGVSCTSSEACTAVGHYTNSSGTETALAERLTGKVWTIQEIPSATNKGLLSVSCTSSEACTGVGHSSSAGVEVALAERWNGKTWASQSVPSTEGSQSSALTGVSCAGSEACTSVGDYINIRATEVALGAVWSGKEWTSNMPPSPGFEPAPRQSRLAAVSCLTTGACAGVGRSINSLGGNSSLAELWGGEAWAIKEVPTSVGVGSASLTGLTCIFDHGLCVAVGNYLNTAGVEVPLAATSALLEGVWSLDLPLVPSGAKSSALQGVSCTTSEACTAVGLYVNSGGTEVSLAEKLSGKTWTIQETPNPTEAKVSSLAGVSCTSSEACVAVGRYVSSAGVEKTLVEVLSGKTWTVQESPNPAGAKASSLAGVSCTSSEACSAVGHYTSSSGTETALAERWNGKTWTIQTVPSPEGAKASSLSGVSCSTSELCMGDGDYISSAGTELALGEEYH